MQSWVRRRGSPAIAAAESIALPFPLYLTGISSIRDTEDIVAIEGRFLEALSLRRRRNRGIVHGKINQAKRAKGRINCEAPRMDPSEFYGTKAELLCDVHHLTALSNSDIPVKTAFADLAVLCPNCNRAIHLIKPLPTVENFRRALQRRAGGQTTASGRMTSKSRNPNLCHAVVWYLSKGPPDAPSRAQRPSQRMPTRQPQALVHSLKK